MNQPAFDLLNSPQLEAIIQRNQELEGPLLPVLHDVQEFMGYIPTQWIDRIAKGLNLSKAEVHGVISFYHHFRTDPPALHQLQICRAEACQAMGSRTLELFAKSQLGLDFGQQKDDQSIELEPVYCLGNCACAPSVMIDGQVYGRVSNDKLSSLISALTKD